MKKLIVSVLGVVLFLALSPFSYAASAAYPEFGPQTYEVHKYYYFGDSNFDAKSREGIDISVDPSSVSYQSVKATVTMDYNAINDRKITKFVVLANGINVDEFEPYFDYSENPPVYKEYYYLDINVSNQYIGSKVYFQVVALRQDSKTNSSSNVFVVGWSQETPTYQLKPLPVTDGDTHGLINESNNLLDAILRKLDDLKNALLAKLDSVQKAVEDIYTVKPQTQSRFDAALSNLEAKLPNKQVENEVTKISDMMDESADRVKNVQSELVFGNVTLMGKVTTPLLDFTLLEASVEKIRALFAIILWCEFFIFVIRILVPRFTA